MLLSRVVRRAWYVEKATPYVFGAHYSLNLMTLGNRAIEDRATPSIVYRNIAYCYAPLKVKAAQ